MDGFTKLPKMQHFKEGGSVQREVKNFTKRDRKSVEEADTKQDKKIVKKAFGMHDNQMHEGEKTDLTALKKGGRAKKKEGTVKKFCGGGNAYKEGGSVTNVYEAKKTSGDLDNIKKTKDIKPGKADAPSKATEKPNFKGSDVKKTNKMPAGSTKAKEVTERPKAADSASGAKGGPNKYKCGGGVKKMAVGGSTLQDLMQAKELARLNNARKYLGKGQQGEFAGTEMNQTPAMTGMGQTPAPMPAPAVQAPGGTSPAGAIPAQKRGGKVKKMNTGGTCP